MRILQILISTLGVRIMQEAPVLVVPFLLNLLHQMILWYDFMQSTFKLF